jgi:transposase-like protein
MTTDKRGISALLLQRQLGLGCCETAWMMLHKFRRAMGNLEREPLRGEVEVDDTWIGGTQAGLRGSRQLKGRKAALVIVAVEKRGRASGRVRMAVIPDFKSVTLNAFVQQNVAPASTIYTDGLKSFVGFKQAGLRHIPRTQPLQGDLRKGAKSVVPFADRAIGNLQQWLIGTYHGVSRDQLQVYLDEFVFRHNRRQTPMAAFQTLLGLGAARRPVPYTHIKGASDLSKLLQKTEPQPMGALLKQPDKQKVSSVLSLKFVYKSVRRSRGFGLRFCARRRVLGLCCGFG